MEYVRMPEMLSPEAIKALAGNAGAIRQMMENDAVSQHNDSNWSNCPKKVKFIFILNNVVILNINATAPEENNGPL